MKRTPAGVDRATAARDTSMIKAYSKRGLFDGRGGMAGGASQGGARSSSSTGNGPRIKSAALRCSRPSSFSRLLPS